VALLFFVSLSLVSVRSDVRLRDKTSRGRAFEPRLALPAVEDPLLFSGGAGDFSLGSSVAPGAGRQSLSCSGYLSLQCEGIEAAFSRSKRRLICDVTSALAKTRASGCLGCP